MPARYPHRLTASKLEQARSCLFWARHDVKPDPWSGSREAGLGTAVHECASCIVSGTPFAVADIFDKAVRDNDADPDDFETAAAMVDRFAEWWEQHGSPAWRSESAYAWDPIAKRARYLGQNIGRKYRDCGAQVGDVCGSIDLELVEADRVTVIDIKTGRHRHDPNGHRQLAHNALCAARHHNRGAARVGILTVTVGGCYLNTADLDAFALLDVEEELLARVESVPGAKPRAGSHCRFCSAKGSCPEAEKMTAAIVPAQRLAMGRVESVESARAWYDALPLLEAAIKAKREEIKALADSCGGRLDFGDGRAYARVTETRETVDGNRPGVIDVLTRELGEHAREAVKVKVSKTGIDKAVAKTAARGTKAKRVEAILDEIRAMGASKVSTFDTWEEVKA